MNRREFLKNLPFLPLMFSPSLSAQERPAVITIGPDAVLRNVSIRGGTEIRYPAGELNFRRGIEDWSFDN